MRENMRKRSYVDLHLHLDGAITPAIARKLADLQGISLTEDEGELAAQLSVSEDCESLNDFLKCFALPLSLLQTREAMEEAVYLVMSDLEKQGVIYTEIKFAPQLHQKKGMSQEEVVLAALAGLKKSGLKGNLILCFMRGTDTEAENMETLRVAEKYLVQDGGVVAVDLAGAEALYPTRDYKAIFDMVREKTIPFTIHAGEADGADSVKCAVKFGVKRIGHGTRAYEDEQVLEWIQEKGIFVDMCPTSNRQTCALKNFDDFPIQDYLHRGIKVTLNTDDPAIENTTIEKEFDFVERKFGVTKEQQNKILYHSIEAAFTTEEVKEELRKMVKEREEETC